MPALHELTISAIQRARQQGGIVDPVEDFAAIADLDRLARACSDMPAESRLLFLDLPVIVGDVKLYRLSWGAIDWMVECAAVWFSDNGSLYDRAIAWAHAHARSPGAFRRCASRREAEAEIWRWSREISAPWQAVLAAVDELTSELSSKKDGTERKDRTRTSDAPILESLIEQYGKTLDYWLWDISAAVFASLLKAHQIRIDRLESASSTAHGKAPDPESHYVRATISFQRAAKVFVSTIVERNTRHE